VQRIEDFFASAGYSVETKGPEIEATTIELEALNIPPPSGPFAIARHLLF